MTSDVSVTTPPMSEDELSIYKRLYRQALAQIEELQEQVALSRSLIQHHEELAVVLQDKLRQLEQRLSECEDRLKSEQKRSAQFRLALERCQTTEQEAPAPEAKVEAWAVQDVASAPPIPPLETTKPPAQPPNTYQKRSIDSLAAVQLPQFPSLRQR